MATTMTEVSMVTAFIQTLLPPNPSFAGHQTFAVRSGWLKKGLDALLDPRKGGGPTVFTEDDALVILGVGKNMVQSIRHWLVVTGMAEEHEESHGLKPTVLGQAIFVGDDAWDPFLEDIATLWLLHWQLAGPGSQAFSWVWAFNEFREYEFSRNSLTDSVLAAAAARGGKTPSRETISRDVECMLHTYVRSRTPSTLDDIDSPLQSLGLIVPSFDTNCRFSIGTKPSLPPCVFYYALTRYWEFRQRGRDSLAVSEAVYGAGSPGMVFKLDEDSVLAYLDNIEIYSGGNIVFDDSPMTRTVKRTSGVYMESMTFLKDHYARNN